MNGQMPSNLSRTGYDINTISQILAGEFNKLQQYGGGYVTFLGQVSNNNWNNNIFQSHLKTVIDIVDYYAQSQMQGPVENACSQYAIMSAAVWFTQNPNLLNSMDPQMIHYINQNVQAYNQLMGTLYNVPQSQYAGFNQPTSPMGQPMYQNPSMGVSQPPASHYGVVNRSVASGNMMPRQPMMQQGQTYYPNQPQQRPMGFHNQSVILGRQQMHQHPAVYENDDSRGDIRALRDEYQREKAVEQAVPTSVRQAQQTPTAVFSQITPPTSKAPTMEQINAITPIATQPERQYITTREELKEVQKVYPFDDAIAPMLISVPPAFKRLQVWVEDGVIKQQVLDLVDMNKDDHLTVLAPYRSSAAIPSKASVNPFSTKLKSGFEVDPDNTFQVHLQSVMDEKVKSGEIVAGTEFANLSKEIQDEVCIIAARRIRDAMNKRAKEARASVVNEVDLLFATEEEKAKLEQSLRDLNQEEIVECEEPGYGTDFRSIIANIDDQLFTAMGKPLSYYVHGCEIDTIYKHLDPDEISVLKTQLSVFEQGKKDIQSMHRLMKAKTLPAEIWNYIEQRATVAVNKGLKYLLKNICQIDSFTDDMADLNDFLGKAMTDEKIKREHFLQFLQYVTNEITVFSQPDETDMNEYAHNLPDEDKILLRECSICRTKRNEILVLNRTSSDLGFDAHTGLINVEAHGEIYNALLKLSTLPSRHPIVLVTSDKLAYRVVNSTADNRTTFCLIEV